MEKLKLFIILFILFQFYQGLLGVNYIVKVEPKEIVANPGENVTFICSLVANDSSVLIPDFLESCMFKMGGEDYLGNDTSLNLAVYKNKEKNTCIITINKVRKEGYDVTYCSMVIKGSGKAFKGPMTLQVAKEPQAPKIHVTEPSNGGNTSAFQENDTLTATCTVEDGWPVAVISWYLDTQLMDGLPKPTETCKNVGNNKVCTVQQSFTRTLQSSDDKKVLKCLAKHQSYKGGEMSAEFTIDVNYGPKLVKPINNVTVNNSCVKGKFTITVKAKPKPEFEWYTGDYASCKSNRSEDSEKGNWEYESTLDIDCTLSKNETWVEVNVSNALDTIQHTFNIAVSDGHEGVTRKSPQTVNDKPEQTNGPDSPSSSSSNTGFGSNIGSSSKTGSGSSTSSNTKPQPVPSSSFVFNYSYLKSLGIGWMVFLIFNW